MKIFKTKGCGNPGVAQFQSKDHFRKELKETELMLPLQPGHHLQAWKVDIYVFICIYVCLKRNRNLNKCTSVTVIFGVRLVRGEKLLKTMQHIKHILTFVCKKKTNTKWYKNLQQTFCIINTLMCGPDVCFVRYSICCLQKHALFYASKHFLRSQDHKQPNAVICCNN